jgi:hypothetical protein
MQRARFEKAATLTRIAIETALAVVHQLGTGDPFTAFARAFAAGALVPLSLLLQPQHLYRSSFEARMKIIILRD